MIRYDKNQNGRLDGEDERNSEVMDAYYGSFRLQIEGLISGMIPIQGRLLEWVSPIMFRHLIKKGMPEIKLFNGSILKLLRFVVQFKKQGADAERVTVANVLNIISETSENNQAHPFKCRECLSDPTPEGKCEPEGDW
jgi:hypothetical protein